MARRPWFKHFGTSSEGATLSALWDNDDFEAYGLWWRLLEMMCRFEDENRPGTMTIALSTISRDTGWKPSKCLRVLSRISSVSKIELEQKQEGIYTFLIPKWSELNSSWGGKRESRFEQDAGRSKKLEVRSKIVSSDQSPDRFRAITCYHALDQIFQERKVTKEVQESWTIAFPQSEWVVEKIKQLIAWEAANPGRKKKNFSRFVTNCLSRDWDKRKVQTTTGFLDTEAM